MGRLEDIFPEAGKSFAADEIRKCRTKGLSALDGQLLNAPDLAEPWVKFIYSVRTRGLGISSPLLKEMILCRIAALNSSSYEWMHHEPLARAAGMTNQQIEYIRKVPTYERPAIITTPTEGLFTPEQESVLELIDHSTLNIKVPENVFYKARQHFDSKQIAEVMITISAYNMVSRFLVGMDVMGAANIEVGELYH